MRTKILAVAHEAEPDEGPEVQLDGRRQRRAEAADVLAETLLDLWLRRGDLGIDAKVALRDASRHVVPSFERIEDPFAAAGRPPKDASPDERDAFGTPAKRDLAGLSKQ